MLLLCFARSLGLGLVHILLAFTKKFKTYGYESLGGLQMWYFNNFQLLESHRRKEVAVRKLVRFQKPNNLGC